MKTQAYWFKLLTYFLFTIIFTQTLSAVNIELDGTINKINGDGNNSTCHTGDIFRLGNKTNFNGQSFDILIKVLAEDNQADTLTDFSLSNFPKRRCIGLNEKNSNLIEFILRDKEDENGMNDADKRAYMDLEISTVKQGTQVPLPVDRMQFTALDLDRSGKLTLSDDIYLSSPGQGYIGQNDINISLVTIETGDYGNGYDILLQGNRDDKAPGTKSGNCDDTIENPQTECRGYGVIETNASSSIMRLRVANDNAFADFTPDDPLYGKYSEGAYRLIQVSLDEGKIGILGVDHGDMPESYGDAYHDINISVVLGTGPADGETPRYSVNADADDADVNASSFDDEGAVSIVDEDSNGSVFTVYKGNTYDFNITTTGNGYLNAWADYNLNGTFDGDDEWIIRNQVIASATTTYTIVSITVPADSEVGKSYIRFRFSQNAGIKAFGDGGNGEVEDYVLDIRNSQSVSGQVYNDKNGNGDQDAGEPNFPNVRVTITAANGETQTTTTDINGNYSFSNVPAGVATIDIDNTTLPDGAALTEGTDPTSVTIGDIKEPIVNGYQLQANLVTLKTVNNETPKEGEIIVYTLSVENKGPSVATNVSLTDKLPTGVTYVSHIANGSYDNTNGKWLVGTIPNSQTETLQIKARVNAGTSGEKITNITTAATSPDSNDSTPTGDDLNETIEVGGKPTVSISDANVTEGENLVFNVTLSEASKFDTVINVHTVDDTAHAGTDYTSTTKTVTISAGSTSAQVTVPSKQDTIHEPTESFRLEGNVTSDNTQNKDPNATGTIIDDDPAQIEANDDSVDATVGDTVTIDVLANDTSDVAFDKSTLKIIDPETNATVTELVVEGEGTWKVDPNTGEITFTPEAGFVGDPTPISYQVSDIDGNVSNPATVTINYAQGTVAGVVYEDTNGNTKQDPNEPGIEGVKVVITDEQNNTTTLTTNAYGQYAMEVPEGNTTITIDEGTITTGSTHTEGTNPTSVNVPEDGIARDIDGYEPPENAGTIEGLVYEDTNGNGRQDVNESGLEGVKVEVTDADGHTQIVTTDSEGKYTVTVPAGEITVDINDSTTPGGSIHTEGTDPVTVTVAENGTQRIIDGYKPAENTGTLEGLIYEDTNGNGTKDADESGLEGVTVRITDAQGHVQEVTTDENGTYSVLVPVGEAVATIDESTLPGGSKQTDGENPTTLTVEKDTTVSDKDGYKLPANKGKIEGIVYADLDGNGHQESSEPGIEGISVSIIDNRGSIQTLVTDSQGKYSTAVVAGSAVIDIADEDLAKNLQQTEGIDPSHVTVPLNGVARDVDGFTTSDAPNTLDDKVDNVTIGEPVTIDVLGNDTDPQDDIDPTTVVIVDPTTGDPVTTLVVPDEGTWTVDPTTGKITFTPVDGFTGDPTAIKYTVADDQGNVSEPASVTVDYNQPIDAKDDYADAKIGESVEIDVLANDTSDNGLDPKSVVIIDPVTGDSVKELVVPDEGTWTVDPTTGKITFTPLDGFTDNPTPIQYTVADDAGTVSRPAIVGVNYTNAPTANNDDETAKVGDTVTINILGNDNDNESDINASTVNLIPPSGVEGNDTDGDGFIDTIVVPHEGTWKVDNNGTVTFIPNNGFTKDPTPIKYVVSDSTGAPSNPATITIDVLQELRNDRKTAAPGSTVTLNILANDDDVVASTVNLIGPEGSTADQNDDGYTTKITVPDEGVWEVDDKGILTFTPDTGFEQDPTPITYTAEDNSGHVLAPATVVIDYTNEVEIVEHNNTNTVYVNRPYPVLVSAPVAEPETAELVELDAVDDNMTLVGDGPLVADVALNDRYADGTFHLIDRTSNLPMKEGETLRLDYGSVTMNSNGTYTYTPYPETLTMDAYIEEDFQYILADGAGNSDIANVHICVTFECPNTSDADALSNVGLSMLFFMLAMVGLYFIRKEESII